MLPSSEGRQECSTKLTASLSPTCCRVDTDNSVAGLLVLTTQTITVANDVRRLAILSVEPFGHGLPPLATQTMMTSTVGWPPAKLGIALTAR